MPMNCLICGVDFSTGVSPSDYPFMMIKYTNLPLEVKREVYKYLKHKDCYTFVAQTPSDHINLNNDLFRLRYRSQPWIHRSPMVRLKSRKDGWIHGGVARYHIRRNIIQWVFPTKFFIDNIDPLFFKRMHQYNKIIKDW